MRRAYGKKLLTATLLLGLTCTTNLTKAATLFENFDNPSVAATTNNGVAITYNSGNWYSFGITKPTTATENDRINGSYSIRMRGLDAKNSLYMQFDKAGAGTLSFVYGSYSNNSDGEIIVQQSTNGGTTWTALDTVSVPKWSGTFLSYSLPVNYNGNIRFKILAMLRSVNNPNQQFNIDDFMVTDYGTEQVSTPVSNVNTGIYGQTQSVVLSTATSNATIYYTTDGSTPTTSSNVYNSPLNISSTTTLRAIAAKAGMINSREQTVLISFPIEVSTIADFVSKMANSGTNLTYIKFTGEAIISYAYTTTTSAAYGNTVTKYMFIQDNTGGISLKDNNRNLLLNYDNGDKVTGITGQVFNVNNTAQIYPATDFSVLSKNNTLSPSVITIADIATKVNQLVQLNNVYFDGADGIKTFSVNSSVFLREGTTTVSTLPVRITSNLTVAPDYQGSIIPVAACNIAGIVSRIETSYTDYSVFVRKASDLNMPLSGIKQTAIRNLYLYNNSIVFDSEKIESLNIFNSLGQLRVSKTTSIGKNIVYLESGIYFVQIGKTISKIVL